MKKSISQNARSNYMQTDCFINFIHIHETRKLHVVSYPAPPTYRRLLQAIASPVLLLFLAESSLHLRQSVQVGRWLCASNRDARRRGQGLQVHPRSSLMGREEERVHTTAQEWSQATTNSPPDLEWYLPQTSNHHVIQVCVCPVLTLY